MRSLLDTGALPPPTETLVTSESSSSSSSHSFNPSLIIIVLIIAFVIIFSASIHFLLRHLSNRRRRSSSSTTTISNNNNTSSSSISSRREIAERRRQNKDRIQSRSRSLVDALPEFSLSSTAAALGSRPPPTECAVCLSRFVASDKLRLLPACSHAFHSGCVDEWLRSTPSCPLCRSPLRLPRPNDFSDGHRRPTAANSISLNTQPQQQEQQQKTAVAEEADERRTMQNNNAMQSIEQQQQQPLQSKAEEQRRNGLTESSMQLIEQQQQKRRNRMQSIENNTMQPMEQQQSVQLKAEEEEERRNWLRDYWDRIATSAASSFSSVQCSSRWNCDVDTDAIISGGCILDPTVRKSSEISDHHATEIYRWITSTPPEMGPPPSTSASASFRCCRFDCENAVEPASTGKNQMRDPLEEDEHAKAIYKWLASAPPELGPQTSTSATLRCCRPDCDGVVEPERRDSYEVEGSAFYRWLIGTNS